MNLLPDLLIILGVIVLFLFIWFLWQAHKNHVTLVAQLNAQLPALENRMAQAVNNAHARIETLEQNLGLKKKLPVPPPMPEPAKAEKKGGAS